MATLPVTGGTNFESERWAQEERPRKKLRRTAQDCTVEDFRRARKPLKEISFEYLGNEKNMSSLQFKYPFKPHVFNSKAEP
jgi:hypothetical protein